MSRAIFREKLIIIIIYILWLRDIKYIYTYIFLREESAQTVADPSDLSDNRTDASRARRIRIDRNEENPDPLCFFFLSFVSWFSFSSFEFIWFNIKMELTACEYFWLLGEKKNKEIIFLLPGFLFSLHLLPVSYRRYRWKMLPPDELLSLPFVRFRSVLVSSCLRPLLVANISDGSMKRSVDSYESWREHERNEEFDSVTFAVCASNTMTRGLLARFFTRHPTKN